MVRRWLTILVSVVWPAAGCSLLNDLSGFAGPARDEGEEAGREGRAPDDAAPLGETAPPIDAGRCSPSKPFGAPVPLGTLNLPTENDRAARLTPDELTIYFSSDRSNERRIYRATRANVDDAFGPPALLDELAPPLAFLGAAPTADGLELILETRITDGGTGRSDLARATRATPGGRFGAPANIMSTTQDETDPHLTAGDLELWFATPTGGSTYDIFIATRATRTAAFGTPTPLPGAVNQSATAETDPVPSADGSELFLQTDRQDGGPRVWVAHRASTSEPFGAPTHVRELDGTGASDVPNWLSPDRCALYLTSSGPDGIAKLYVAKRGR